MKKCAVIVGYRESELSAYREQLRSLFLDALELRSLLVGAPEPGAASVLEGADLALFPSYEAFERCCPGGPRPRHILFAERTLSREGFARLAALEGRGELLLFDETRAMAERMVEALRRMGYAGPSLAPAARGDDAAGRTALLLGAGFPAPRGASRLVDLGEAFLDVSSVIDIGIRLDLDPFFHRQSIQNSYRELETANRGLADILGKMNRCEGSLDIILRAVDAGVLSVDAEGLVSSCNDQAALLLGKRPADILGVPASEAFPRIPFRAALETKTPIVDRLETIGGREIGYSIGPILHSGILYGAVAVLSGKGERGAQHRLDARELSKGHRARYAFEDLVAESEAMRRCRDIAKRTAASASSVLVCGESGTGKEVIAQAIHNASGRRARNFVAVNCGALPESLLESELFGYEEGAFTGARKGGKPGLFELAHHGTLFLDEMGGMPPSIQTRLLRVLEEREVMRLGSDRVIGVDIRVIAASNRDLRSMIAEGTFREDLYYRLNVLPIYIPPLRERPEDLFPLIERFQKQFGISFELEPEARALLLAHDWPGNARELRNYVEYIASLGIARVGAGDLPRIEGPSPRPRPLPSPEARAFASGGAGGEEEKAKTRFILEELEAAFERQLRLGRRSLYQAAKERHLYLSEQEIRSALKRLEEEGLVAIKPGKGGTRITRLGQEALAESRRSR
ncbi:MAG TPA: sigma 54-interacting transcriptional regulator [Spirochaetia bacterium]|nr:sigma 54-interacting transcriptional regulator [Spirochaetia bacterium]